MSGNNDESIMSSDALSPEPPRTITMTTMMMITKMSIPWQQHGYHIQVSYGNQADFVLNFE